MYRWYISCFKHYKHDVRRTLEATLLVAQDKSRYINYIRISINISYICHVWDRMTPTIDKEALLRIPITKRGRKKKKWINRGWADTIPGFVLSRNISYIPIWYDVWYHTRYNDAGDEQRGMITHSYHKQGTKKNVPGVCPGDTRITSPGFRAGG